MTNTTMTKEKETENTVEANPINKSHVRPVADVYRDQEAVRVLLDLPGATREDIDVSVHDEQLTIKAEVSRADSEIRVYERTFRVDHRMDTLQLEALLENGVLEVRIPYHKQALPRKIEVKSKL